MPETTTLTIGELSRRSGLSHKALRLYGDSGLLRPAHVDDATGYRHYRHDQVRRARLIGLLRGLGMPLADIARIVDQPSPDAEQRLRAWWAAREAEAADRRAVVGHVARLLGDPARLTAPPGGAPGATSPVRTRTDPPLKLAVVTSLVDQHQLLAVINASVIELTTHVARSGAVPGAEYHVLYRGVVGPDDDGRVEVCVPFSGTVEPTEEILLRVEPAQDLALVPVTAEQCRYPQILHAYDALSAWVQQHGSAVSSAREIYPMSRPASADQAACLVAQPFRRAS